MRVLSGYATGLSVAPVFWLRANLLPPAVLYCSAAAPAAQPGTPTQHLHHDLSMSEEGGVGECGKRQNFRNENSEEKMFYGMLEYA